MQNNIIANILIVIIALIAFSCSNKKLENLGLLKKKANEYSISRKAPLIMPPDMYLRPPKEEKMTKRIEKENNQIELNLDDILLGKELKKRTSHKKIKKQKFYKKEKIIEKILRTKETVVLN